MPNYRRLLSPGGCYFFTVNLFDRDSRLLTDNIEELRAAVRDTRQRFPFAIDAMVILPDHIHAVWTLPEGDTDFAVRWRWIKIRFSRAIPVGEPLSATRRTRGERGIWQRRYWEHLIRDDRDLAAHIDYCWFNPVKHGLVRDVEDWPYSTFHRDNRVEPTALSRDRARAEFERGQCDRFGERE